MVVNEHYPFNIIEEGTVYLFVSKGKQGRILKAIAFQSLEDGTFNLAFGDIVKGRLDDKIVSNNQDLKMIINTVAKATCDFLESYPDKKIMIIPVDDRRKLVYNWIFQHRIHEIALNFEVIGYLGDLDIKNLGQPYQSDIIFDYFSIKLKK